MVDSEGDTRRTSGCLSNVAATRMDATSDAKAWIRRGACFRTACINCISCNLTSSDVSTRTAWTSTCNTLYSQLSKSKRTTANSVCANGLWVDLIHYKIVCTHITGSTSVCLIYRLLQVVFICWRLKWNFEGHSLGDDRKNIGQQYNNGTRHFLQQPVQFFSSVEVDNC